MALTYEVCQMRETGYSASSNNSGGMKSCQISLTQVYRVIVTDPANANFAADDVTDVHVAFAPGIPIVNYHTWYDSTTNVGIPLAVCNSKTVRRLDSNATVFEVTCAFATEPGKQSKAQESETPSNPQPETPPASVTDIDPVVTRGVVGRDIVMHAAPAYGPNGSAVILGPNLNAETISTRFLPVADAFGVGIDGLRNEIDQPVTRKKPLLQLTITQFEDTFTDQDLLDRCYKVNLTAYRGFVIKAAMITNINAVAQSVQMAAGPAEKYRVTYTILVDDYTVVSDANATLFVGHAAAVPLIGHWHLDANDDAVQFQQTGAGIGAVGLLNLDGTAKDPDDTPDYVRFDTVEETEFNLAAGGFLQV
jgi:hypothetical protein